MSECVDSLANAHRAKERQTLKNQARKQPALTRDTVSATKVDSSVR